jgi:tetratricopeptide (TPR) repeat protein
MKKIRRRRPHQFKQNCNSSLRQKQRIGDLGIFSRDYPPAEERADIINSVLKKPTESRTSDDWWLLGEYQVYDGLLEENDDLINAGIEALSKGCNLPTPSPACMLDLGWILLLRGLDSLALPYLERAVALAPNSRDGWTFKAWAHVGNQQREYAIDSMERAVKLPSATQSDRELLEDLLQGKELSVLRRNLVLRKTDLEDIKNSRYSDEESYKAFLPIANQLLKTNPQDRDLLYSIAITRYKLGQFSKAQDLSRQILALKEDAETFVLLGCIATKQNDDNSAIEWYQKALQIDPVHMLALTNLASALQNQGNYHAARPLLQCALKQPVQGNPHYAIALDLYGSNVGNIEQDFEQEIAYHRQAFQLDATRVIFHANLVVSLLSAGKLKEALRHWNNNRERLTTLPNYETLEMLIYSYTSDSLVPSDYLALIEVLHESLGWNALQPLIKKAWLQRNSVLSEERLGFYSAIGQVAHRANLCDLALEIWREAANLEGGEANICNVAVILSALERHSEALDVAETMPMNTPRSWTILGNTRLHAGLLGSALDAYRRAIENDERFLLPYSNAIQCARSLRSPEELDPFVSKLGSEWNNDESAKILLAQAHLLQGKPSQAADVFQSALWHEDVLQNPEELYENTYDSEDWSLFTGPTIQIHFDYAIALLRARRFEELAQLIGIVKTWHQWVNGDWSIIYAEMLRLQQRFREAIQSLASMADQPPPHLTRALCCLDEGDRGGAESSATQALAHSRIEDFNHPEGRPDAVGHAILAEVLLQQDEFEEAEIKARRALMNDPACPLARLVLGKALSTQGQEDEAAEIFLEGMRRTPGELGIVAAGIDTLIRLNKIDQAHSIYIAQRPLLLERAGRRTAERLSNLISFAKRQQNHSDGRGFSEIDTHEWPWLFRLPDTLRHWMVAACMSKSHLAQMRSAYVLYLGKTAEYIIQHEILIPFRACLKTEQIFASERFTDLCRFMNGGHSPSIGGFARFLKAAFTSRQHTEDVLVAEFRKFITRPNTPISKFLAEKNIVNRLYSFGNIRNEAAHSVEPDNTVLCDAVSVILDGSDPGPLLKHLVLGDR